MGTSWNFINTNENTSDIQVYDGTGATLAGIRYNGDFNQPAVLQTYLPTSNINMLTTLAQKDFDIMGDGTFTLNAASSLMCSDSLKHNEYSLEGFLFSPKIQTWSGSPGDGTNNLYPSDENGVGMEWFAGDAGSIDAATGGGFKWKVGNKNGNVGSKEGVFDWANGNNLSIMTLFQLDETEGHQLGGAFHAVNFFYHDGSGVYGLSFFAANAANDKAIRIGGENSLDFTDWIIQINQTPVLKDGTIIDETTTTIDLATDGVIYKITSQTTIENITFNGGTPPEGASIKVVNNTGSAIAVENSADIFCPFNTDYSIGNSEMVEFIYCLSVWYLRP